LLVVSVIVIRTAWEVAGDSTGSLPIGAGWSVAYARDLDEDLFEEELIEEDIDIEDLYEDMSDPGRPRTPKGDAPKTPHTNPSPNDPGGTLFKAGGSTYGPVPLLPNGGLS
jgi:hypothetical protein